MAGIAQHLASFGVRVATPNYCQNSVFQNDHAQNGKNAAELSAKISDGAKVIHAGYSVGGQAAMVAAANDPATIAVLGLDMKDSNNNALNAAASLTIAGLGLVGEPQACNEQGNGRAAFNKMTKGKLIKIVNGGHCDFEEPSGAFCGFTCGGAQVAARLSVIKSLAAAFVAWQSGIDTSGQQWLTPSGRAFQQLHTAGSIQAL
jgi:dienelactone hydrolase